MIGTETLLTLGAGLMVRGPDGGHEYRSPSMCMVYRAFHTNKDSRLEIQPFVPASGHVLWWDGRLDNREELICELDHDLKEDRTDVAIVMAGYLKRGVDFLVQIIGDFALSLWAPDTQTLLLARDAVGPRPLFYCMETNRIIWSSELSPLLDLMSGDLEVDD